MRFHLYGAATMAGSATVTLCTESGTTDPVTVTMAADPGTIVWSEAEQRYMVDHYECVKWQQDCVVDAKLNEPILLTVAFDSDPTHPAYTDFEYVGALNPMFYYSRPSSPCLKLYFDQNDGNWVPEIPLFVSYNPALQIRMKGVLAKDDSTVGDSFGPTAGGGRPVPDVSSLFDSVTITNTDVPCPQGGGGFQMLGSVRTSVSPDSSSTAKAKTIGTARAGFNPCRPRLAAARVATNSFAQLPTPSRLPAMKLPTPEVPEVPGQKKIAQSFRTGQSPAAKWRTSSARFGEPRSRFWRSLTNAANAASRYASAAAPTPSPSPTPAAQAVPVRFSGPGGSTTNGYSIAAPIGRLRWEMSLGSVGRTHSLGKLIYQTDGIDAGAYAPARLSLTAGGDRSGIGFDDSGNLQQVVLNNNEIDIEPFVDGFAVHVYTNGVEKLAWTVQNPDATPQGRIVFTKTEGNMTEIHEAEWQGTSRVGGTMTISRYGGKWIEVRDYSLASNATQRIETVSQYKGTTLQHKVREVYQEFYHWGNPGDVFEALVQRVEDPDHQALTNSFAYWDQSTQPGNLLGFGEYPDGYSELVPYRLSGAGYSPVASSGTPLQIIHPFRDADPTNAGARVASTYFNLITGQQLEEETLTTIGGLTVGDHYVLHTFTNGSWIQQIIDLTDNTGGHAYEEYWQDITTRRPVFILNRDGNTREFSYTPGYWDTSSLQFVSSPGPSTVPALKTKVIHGSALHQAGIANQTTVDVTVEDSFGHGVEQVSYVSNGQGGTLGLIDHQIHIYTDGRLTVSFQNGRLIYQAGYDADGKLLWVEDASGRHTDYAYDELKRVIERTIRGRGGDPDQVCTCDYDVFGNKTSEITVAGGLTNRLEWIYDLTGSLVATVGTDGLTNFINTSCSNGRKVVTETLPTQATHITSYFRDRQPRSVTGTAVEDEFYSEFVYYESPYAFLANAVYRDSGLTQLKRLQIVNWLGNPIILETPKFQSGYRLQYTDYDYATNGRTRQLITGIRETGRATRLFAYDELGGLTGRGLDLDASGTLEPASIDRITTYDRGFANDWGQWQEVSTIQRHLQDNSATPTLLEQTRRTVPAALSGNLIQSNIVERAGGGLTVTTVALDPMTGEQTTINNELELGRIHTRIERDGLLRSATPPGIGTRSYNYTALGELQEINDPVTGNVTLSYDPVTRRLVSAIDSLHRQVTYNYYPAGSPNAGLVRSIQDPAGNWTWFDYTPAGRLFRQWGVNTYPVQQEYDEAGRMTQLVTFRTGGSDVNWASPTWPDPPTGDVTEWIYDPPSGLLAGKVYADDNRVGYGYNAGNFLTARTNGRAQTISYEIDGAGLLRGIGYSDGTPAVTIDYDRAGRMRSINDASGTRSVTWTDRDQVEDENWTAGLLNGVKVSRGYDAQYRPSTLGLGIGGADLHLQRTVYDSISRVDYITDETPGGGTVLCKFDYTFKPETPFVESVGFYRSDNPVMTQNYTWDGAGRLSGANATLAGGAPASGVSYRFDDLDRRYQADLADGTKWNYGYNDRSEVISGKRQLTSGVYAGGEQFEYDYDDIGNRTWTKAGGDAGGANLHKAEYGANALNQHTNRDVPGWIGVVGEAPADLVLEGVAAGKAFAIQRQEGGRFFGEGMVDNRMSAVFARITVAGKTNNVLADVETGNRFVPQNPEEFTYDDDGNLARDGRWNYAWDAENRLVSVTARMGVPDAAKRKLEFTYDSAGRRVQKIASLWNASVQEYQPTTTNLFVYGGWNCIAILDSSFSLLNSFVWGLGLPGSAPGEHLSHQLPAPALEDGGSAPKAGLPRRSAAKAGGAGRLLQVRSHGPAPTNCFPAFDGNGNVLKLVNAADTQTVAEYQYGPFGELLRATGPLAGANPFRFSTEYQDDETDLLYYGYRYYSPGTGRWLSRDPIGENGGLNLYAFVQNDPVGHVDRLGLQAAEKGAEMLLYNNYRDRRECRGDCPDQDKVTIHVVNRGSPVNQAPADAATHPDGQGTLPQWTGGHIDLVIPGCGSSLIGFFGVSQGQSLSASVFGGIPGVVNLTFDDWLKGPARRPESFNHRSYICEVRVCPEDAEAMCSRAKALRSSPPEFALLGRNCSTGACDILNAGNAGPKGGILGPDNPQALQRQLNSRKCYYGYTPIGLFYDFTTGAQRFPQVFVTPDPDQRNPLAAR